MPVIALLPLVLFPALGVSRLEAVAISYANPVIFLFMGGFMIGLAIEKWNLHKRIALNIVQLTGTSGNRILLGFILSTGLISMWLSNTATTMMMFPIAMSVIRVMEDNSGGEGNTRNLSICLLLTIAYASNIGGISTIIGTPPNVAYVAFLQRHNNFSFPFSDWMLLCAPLSLILLGCLYLTLIWLYPSKLHNSPAAAAMISQELKEMGRLSTPERRVLLVFVLTASGWITKDLWNSLQNTIRLDDAMIAIFGTIMLFFIPSGCEKKKIMEWTDTSKMPWGILLLFGGGISLAAQLEQAGLIQLLGNTVAGFAREGFWLVLCITLLSIFISEVMSNVAQVIVFAPVIAGIADSMHVNPLQLGLAMTLGASCAGMLPMGTPPNAIVFGSGRLKLKHMMTAGFIMNIMAAIFISLFCWFLLPLVVRFPYP